MLKVTIGKAFTNAITIIFRLCLGKD